MHDHFASFPQHFSVLGDRLAGGEERDWLFRVGEDGGEIRIGLVRDDVRGSISLCAGVIAEVIGDDLLDVLDRIAHTSICYILFSFILSLYMYMLIDSLILEDHIVSID